MKKLLYVICIFSAVLTAGCCNTGGWSGVERLSDALEAYIDSCDAEIGVAVITDRGDTVCAGAGGRFPLNSVMKLYQAMAVVDVFQQNEVALDSVIKISVEELHPSTYSPMRDTHLNADFGVSVAGLLRYSLQESDNNACDILFDRFCGPGETQAYVGSLGVDSFAISVTERDMADDHRAVDRNWTKPIVAAELIYRLFTAEMYTPVYQNFLKETLTGCRTGEKRLPRPLREIGAVIGHKTGTGFNSADGLPQGINDVGFVRLPNQRSYAIAVFIRTSRTDMESTESMIGDISAIVASHLEVELR